MTFADLQNAGTTLAAIGTINTVSVPKYGQGTTLGGFNTGTWQISNPPAAIFLDYNYLAGLVGQLTEEQLKDLRKLIIDRFEELGLDPDQKVIVDF